MAVEVRGPSGTRHLTATLDCGSDDTLLPAYLAPQLGINLAQAPQGESGTVGGSPIPYDYAVVSLRLSDGYEECEWDAIVGFVAAPMRWAILGHAGALQYFDVQLLGWRRESRLPRTRPSRAPCHPLVAAPVKRHAGRAAHAEHRAALPRDQGAERTGSGESSTGSTRTPS